jgi:hypothetical protein
MYSLTHDVYVSNFCDALNIFLFSLYFKLSNNLISVFISLFIYEHEKIICFIYKKIFYLLTTEKNQLLNTGLFILFSQSHYPAVTVRYLW